MPMMPLLPINSRFSCFLLLILIPLVFAIPSELPRRSCDDRLCFWRPKRSFFNTVRDSVIQKIWNVPEDLRLSSSRQAPHSKGSTPSNLRAQYGDDVVLRFNISSFDELKALADASETLYLDVWEATDFWVDLRLAKEVVPLLLGLLPDSLQNAHTPLMHDLAQAIHESYPSNPSHNGDFPSKSHHGSFTPTLRRLDNGPSGEKDLFFQDYQPMSVISPWMSLMASLFPTHTRLINIGYSYEGREIPALKLGVHPTNNDNPSGPRKTILAVGGSHSREWIGTSTVSYIVYQLITQYGKVPEITKFLEEFDWVFVPTINPDGYIYTWETDRLWRKNRQQTDLRFCQGVDLDRAWGFHWDGESTKSNPCSESYAGMGPFDGVEARRLADWAKNETEKNNVTFVSFLDFHSYSQQVLYPFSYSCSSRPPSLENLEELAMGLAKAIRLTNNHFYGVSSACEGGFTPREASTRPIRTKMELGGGSALDWFYHELGVKYSFQIKLRDTGSYGFLLPKENIVPTGQEAFNAISSLGRFLLSNKGIERVLSNDEKEKAGSGNIVAHPNEAEHEKVDAKAGVADGTEEREAHDHVQQELRRRRRR